eukprot:scaffold6264_cov88-Skeletonema_dohrnii-CCMP3373.AAC.3
MCAKESCLWTQFFWATGDGHLLGYESLANQTPTRKLGKLQYCYLSSHQQAYDNAVNTTLLGRLCIHILNASRACERQICILQKLNHPFLLQLKSPSN